MEDIKYQKLEKIKSDLDNKLDLYNKKINSIIEVPSIIKNNKSEKRTLTSKITAIKIDYKFIIVFVAVSIIVYFLLSWISPEYIKRKKLNKDTYFNEYVICNYKLIGYSLVYSIVITAILILGVYIYNTTQKR